MTVTLTLSHSFTITIEKHKQSISPNIYQIKVMDILLPTFTRITQNTDDQATLTPQIPVL